MGDTKRGRERKGEKKREQRREKDISASLGADDEPPEPEETPPEITDPDLEHVSVTTADEQEDEDEIE